MSQWNYPCGFKTEERKIIYLKEESYVTSEQLLQNKLEEKFRGNL